MINIAQELRQAVLQAAIQGKLTEQLPEDGDARELLAQIKAEKERLIKEKKIKKEKPLEPISEDEVPFDIPSNWEWVRLGQAIQEIIVPQRDKPPFSLNGTIPWCRIEDRDGIFLNGSKSNQYVSEEIIKKMNLKVLPVGTVLNACTGGSIGTIVINTVPCCTNQTFNGIVCGDGVLNWFVFWFLTSKFTELRKSGTGTTIAYVSQDKTKNMLFPLPPLAEQHRIVARVEELMAKIDELEKVENELKTLHQAFPVDMKVALLQAAMQGKLTEQLPEDGNAEDLLKQIKAEKERLVKEKKIKKEKSLAPISEDDVPFDIPENWKWVRLGNISSSGLGKTLNGAKDTGEIKPYLCSINVYWSGLSLDTVKTAKFSPSDIEKYRLVNGDMLICEGGDVGKTVIWDRDDEMYYQNALHRVRMYSDTSQYYIRYILMMYKQTGILDDISKGMTIKHLVQGALNNLCIPLPPLAEQHRIVERLDKLLPLCDSLQTEL